MIETKINLDITSSTLTSVEIKNILEINPSEMYNIGDFIFAGRVKKKTPEISNGVIIKSRLADDKEFEEHLADILTIIREKKGNFFKLKGLTENILTCGIYFMQRTKYEYSTGFYLEKEIVKELAELDINISYEVYVLD